MKWKMGVLGSSGFPVLIHLCCTPSNHSYTINHSNCLHPIALIHFFFFFNQRGTSKDTEQQSGISVFEKRIGQVLCWWLAKANPLLRQPAVHQVRVCTQQFLSTASPFSLWSCALAWVLCGPKSLQRHICSSMNLSMGQRLSREVPALPQSTSISSDLIIPSLLPSSYPFPCSFHVSPFSEFFSFS